MSFVNVAIRIKPFLTKSSEDNNCVDVADGDPPTLFISERQQAYSFDKIFDGNTGQETIFYDVVAPLIEKAISGYNCTVFAYGQTGTGKTYTMGSDLKVPNGKNMGIIRRVFESIFIQTSSLKNIDVEVSMYEIYQEKVHDLLGDNKTPLVVKGFNIIDLTKTKVDNLNSVQKLLFRSCKRRHTGETKQNAWSSRSHAIFTIFLNIRNGEETRCAKLNLVDLAGCESVKKSGTQDNQFNEAIKINMGLLSIGQVINALSSNKTCVPYRESMITRILHDSLNKRNYITLIACISPNSTDTHETIQTLEFALKAKKLRSRPELNNISQECPKSVPSKYRSTPLYDLKTPMKRPNRFIHTSTSVKRPKLNPRTENAIVSENFATNCGVDSTVISPIAKMVMTKLEDRLPQKADFFRCAELYHTMRQLIKDEVLHLTNNAIVSTPTQKSSETIRRNLLPLEENQLPITSSPIIEVKISDGLEDEMSMIESSSKDGINLSGITPQEEDNADSKENVLAEESVLTKGNSAPIFKIPQLPCWILSQNTKSSHDNKNSFAFSTPLVTQNQNMRLNRGSPRLSTSRADVASNTKKESNRIRKSLEQEEEEECTEADCSDQSSQISKNVDQPRRSLRLSTKAVNVLFQRETHALLELSKGTENFSGYKSSDVSSVALTENTRKSKKLRKSIRKSIMRNGRIDHVGSISSNDEGEYENGLTRKSVRKSVRITENILSKKTKISSSVSNTSSFGCTTKNSTYATDSTLQRKNSYREGKHKFSLIRQNDESTDSDSSYVSIRRSNKGRKSADIIDTSQEDIFDENTLRTFPVFARRRSIRLSMKRSQSIVVHNLMMTSYSPYKSPRNNVSKEKKMEMLKNNIFKILNKGSVNDLKKLHTIGHKTAQQILLYRQLNGPYKEIKDLKNILTRGKSFERFLTANCLDFDNIMSNESVQ